MTNAVILAVALAVGHSSEQSRWEALSMLESRDDDFAVGKSGEVSRWQILKGEWRNAVTDSVDRATNSADAFKVCRYVMYRREQHYAFEHGFPILEWHLESRGTNVFMACTYGLDKITDRQFALLWHCPAHVDHPRKDEREYADEFEAVLTCVK